MKVKSLIVLGLMIVGSVIHGVEITPNMYSPILQSLTVAGASTLATTSVSSMVVTGSGTGALTVNGSIKTNTIIPRGTSLTLQTGSSQPIYLTSGWNNQISATRNTSISGAGVRIGAFVDDTIAEGTLIVGLTGKEFNLKGISCTAVLKVTTPAIYDVYINSDTYKIYYATGATQYGFKASAAMGATD